MISDLRCPLQCLGHALPWPRQDAPVPACDRHVDSARGVDRLLGTVMGDVEVLRWGDVILGQLGLESHCLCCCAAVLVEEMMVFCGG